MKLADLCNISSGYIGEIESGRKFPSPDMIEKIANVLEIEPYHFFKNLRNDTSVSDIDKQLAKLPYKTKKEIKAKITKQIKAQISTQINTQVRLSLDNIFSEIYKILDYY